MKTKNENDMPKIFRSSYNKYMKLMMAATMHNHKSGGSLDANGQFSNLEKDSFVTAKDIRAC